VAHSVHHDDEAARTIQRNPANRLGLDYRTVPPRRWRGPIADVHTHVHQTATTRLFFDAADAYGITRMLTMTPLGELAALRQEYGPRLGFIAIPRWREFDDTAAFRKRWLADLAAFREAGARLMKFWVAPPMRGGHGLTLEHAFLRPVIAAGLELGYEFLVHVGDPTVWWRPGGRYADAARFGTKPEQYPQLQWFLEHVAPRTVIGAHFGGNVEAPDFLDELLERHPHFHLDSSATKWVVREIARQPQRVRDFLLRWPDRVLFGSDLVVDEKYDFDHYASRYWVHQMQWETGYRGESPIEDPDAPPPPRLAGLDLPPDVLERLYWGNAARRQLVKA
jgi:predicted TIM-barrel fold metal-dependent hydrolase